MKGGKTRMCAGGEGKGPGRDHSTPTPQTDTRRVYRRGRIDQLMDQEEGEMGDMPDYTPTPEDL